MHKLLERQLKKAVKHSPTREIDYPYLLQLVEESYQEFDKERRLIDRTTALVSKEMLELNQKIQEQSEARLFAIMNNVVDSIITFDISGKIDSANTSTEKIFQKKTKGIIGTSIYALIKKTEQQKFRNLVSRRQSNQPGKSYQKRSEITGLRKDGSEIQMEVSLTVMSTLEGPVFIAVLRDISRQREEEKRFLILAHAIRSISECVVITDMQDNIIFVNSAFLNTYQYTKKEIIGKHISVIRSKADPPEMIDSILPATLAGSWKGELMNRRKDGSHFPIFLSTSVIRSDKDKPLALIGVAIDITERRQAERRLQLANHIISAINNIVLIADEKGEIVYASPSVKRVLGYEVAEVLKEGWWKLSRKDAATINKEKHELIERVKNTSINPLPYERLIYDKKGDPHWILWQDAVGPENTVIGVGVDISSEKKLEEQLHQAQKMEAIGKLAGGIAHDFNNILTAINGYAELALMKMEPKNVLHKDITGILKSGNKARDLVKQLLAFSRKQMIEPKVVNINNLIIDLQQMLYRLIGEDISMKLELASSIDLIKADRGQLEQILVNLIVNARDAINQKTQVASEKEITIKTQNIYLDKKFTSQHHGSQAGPHIQISIHDTGTGIDEKIINKIFDPFFTTKAKTKGTGLGLSTVYGIVKQNQGSIYAQRNGESGAILNIFWPSIDKGLESDSFEIHNQEVSGGRETILFVEDDQQVQNFVVGALKSLGYTVIEAGNGLVALNLIKTHQLSFDLLITDVVMPEMDGKELAEKLKKQKPDLKIIYTSGYTEDTIVKKSILHEGINFLQKPYSVRRLASKIREVLQK